jgi:signal transduction histidine kinase
VTTPRAEGLAVARALLSERLLNARKTHLVRLGVLVFFGGLFFFLGVVLRDPRWQVSPWPLLVWLSGACLAFAVQRVGPRVAAALTLTPALLDMPFIFLLQRAQFDGSPRDSGVAGFTMGLFAVVLAIAALSMSAWQLYATAGSSAVFEVWLQSEAGVSRGAQVTAVILLGITAWLLGYAAQRRQYLLTQMSRTEKLAAVGQLAAAVGHDLRNPLAAVTNAIFVLRRRLDKAGALTPNVLEPLQLAEREVEATRHIVTDLLDFTREGPLERTSVELKPLLEECVSVVKAREQVTVTVALDAVPAVLGARDRLRQVFVNLVQNAVEAIPEGRAGTVTVSGEVLGAQVLLRVRDDGAGMDAATKARVLEPLFTTKKDGTGLGLAIVDSMVKQHGGVLSLDSTLGQGTTVTVQLPRAETFKAARE